LDDLKGATKEERRKGAEKIQETPRSCRRGGGHGEKKAKKRVDSFDKYV